MHAVKENDNAHVYFGLYKLTISSSKSEKSCNVIRLSEHSHMMISQSKYSATLEICIHTFPNGISWVSIWGEVGKYPPSPPKKKRKTIEVGVACINHP